MNEKGPITISITPGTIVATVLILLGFWLAWYLRDLLLVILTAVVFASAIEPATMRMVKWGLPRVIAVVLIYLFAVLVLTLLFYFFVPQVVTETRDLIDRLPAYLDSLQVAPEDTLVSDEGRSLTEQLLQFQDILKTSSTGVLTAASVIFGGLMSFALIVVLSFYFAVQERGLDDFLRMVSPTRHHEYILDLWRRAQHKIGRWLQGQLFLSLIAGVLVYLGLLILGVPYAFLLAIAAAILELIPVFGSIIAAVPAVIISFVDGGTSHALLVILMYVIVNQLQGNVIYPLVVQKVLGVAPLVVILAIIVGAQLGGFLGILISVPIAAAVQEYVNDLQKGRQKLAYPSEDGTVE